MLKKAKKALIACLVFGSIAWGMQERQKNVCKATHLGPYSVAISCTDGADPTGKKLGDTLIISCRAFDHAQSGK